MFPNAGPALRRHAPWLAIVAAALLAHGGCVRSTFYLDDFVQIADTDLVDHGQWFLSGLRRFTYLTYWWTFLAAGMSAPAFHLGNLLLHAALALVVAGFGRDFLARAAGMPPDRAGRVAWWAGLFFAVHPLCSEIPNYARARDIELVSLFTMLAAWAALRGRTDTAGGWRWAWAALAAVFMATYSKEVGAAVAGGSAALVWLGTGDQHGWTRRRVTVLAGAVVLAGVMVAAVPGFHEIWTRMMNALMGPRLGWHVLTQARVFWLYAARVVLPVRLCSDHQIAWTRSAADAVAWVALAGLLGITGATAWAWTRQRWRAAGLLGALALLAVLHRCFIVSSELMVEYRVYPAMMFLCLLLAWGCDRWRGTAPGRAGRVALGMLVGGWIVLSAARTLDWRNSETLRANIIAQYPLQARARQEAQEADIRAGRWQAVLDRQPEIRMAMDAALAYNRAQNRRWYDVDLLTLTRVASEGNDAMALAHLGRMREARAHCAWLMNAMEANHVTERMYWGNFYYARGMVYDMARQPNEAVLDLRQGYEMSGMEFIKRQWRRVAGETPGPRP